MRLAPEGIPILIAAAGFAVICAVLALLWGGKTAVWIVPLSFILLLFAAWFFRDPIRVAPDLPGALVAPADGKIIEISQHESGDYFNEDHLKISIFMSPFNVHVNYIPIGGAISDLRYNRGKFLTAFHDKASDLNEQQYIEIDTGGRKIGCVQIAGWFARRIVCHLSKGQKVSTGERFGMIRFGSRLDLYIPGGFDLKIGHGQRVTAGETVIGVLHEKE
ncbi:phosphatidylserine decarboxylase family protein [candidate division LCP-89 bacterium B3_LCP]|uniref:Phosphatidylserine decarboxylase proenzyme n=1 Tax=candidate division LCP-89 bacterium B3_LCP TaxID=2012998 RepID=A0A532UZC8_UNCL8|nr:MAG: phosphatidylserine decarboxylase family protein [candidate division LCP-89 bacterium B3_LCP]